MPLVIVPTPIGNLEDITLRALRALREADLIACEDTRRAGRLLKHYGIEGRLLAYHEHNEVALTPELAGKALTERVALITDAGMPAISDPGYRLIQACIENKAQVEVLPGPSAPITALVASGLPQDVVVFLGFVPRKGGERTKVFERIQQEEATFVLLESPHRLIKTLAQLPVETSVAVARELTKLHEEVFRGTVREALEHFGGGVKGEVVLVVRGGAVRDAADLDSAIRQAQKYLDEGMPPSKAASRAARELGRDRREVYENLIESGRGR